MALLAAQTKVSELTIALEKEQAAHEGKRVVNEALEKSKAELTNVLAVKEQEAIVAAEARTKNEKNLTESVNEAKAEGKRQAEELKAITTEAKISSGEKREHGKRTKEERRKREGRKKERREGKRRVDRYRRKEVKKEMGTASRSGRRRRRICVERVVS